MLLMAERTDTVGVDDAAAMLGVSRATVLRLIDRKKLVQVNEDNPVLQRPRRILLRREDVERIKRGE